MEKMMREFIKEWNAFEQDQKDRRAKVEARMRLWHTENEFPARDSFLAEMYFTLQEMEVLKLNAEFGVVPITVENFLSSLAKKYEA